jgi:hypothetical protein
MAKDKANAVEKVNHGGSALPVGEKIERDGGEVTPLDAATIRLVMQGWALKKQLDELDAQLKAIHAQLIEAHGVGASLIVRGLCRASIAEREAVRIKDAERLKAVLGERFTDLVKVEVAYKPEQRLIDMACAGDEPLQPVIGACLTFGKSTSVTWRAEK